MSAWLLLAFGAFLCNGLVLVAQKWISAHYATFTQSFLVCSFLTSALACVLALTVRRRWPKPHELALGAVAGLLSYGGNIFLLQALRDAPSYRVLPVMFGVWMVVVAVVSWTVMKERLSRRRLAALLVGILAVVLLSASG